MLEVVTIVLSIDVKMVCGLHSGDRRRPQLHTCEMRNEKVGARRESVCREAVQLRQSTNSTGLELMNSTALRWPLAAASRVGRVMVFYKGTFL